MADRDVALIVSKLEDSRASHEGHTHNFDDAYRQIVQLQVHDGGPTSRAFKEDMKTLNAKLHADGVLSNLEIVGVDKSHHKFLTRDIADSRTYHDDHVVGQDASVVNDFGALGSGRNPLEKEDAFRAKLLGVNVERNPDGSFEVDNPFDKPGSGAAFLNSIFEGLMGDGGGAKAKSGSDGTRPLGMNSLLFQAWSGWSDSPSD